MHRSSQHGITALELMVAMAIVTILLSAGVPAFKNYTWNLRMKTAMDMLQTDLKLARGRAISHNVETVICPATGNGECSGFSDWQDGWIVFTDINGDRQKQAGEPLLKNAVAVSQLTISSSLSRSYLRFYPNGSAPGSNLTIVFCDRRGAAKAGSVTVASTGRIRMATNGVESSTDCP